MLWWWRFVGSVAEQLSGGTELVTGLDAEDRQSEDWRKIHVDPREPHGQRMLVESPEQLGAELGLVPCPVCSGRFAVPEALQRSLPFSIDGRDMGLVVEVLERTKASVEVHDRCPPCDARSSLSIAVSSARASSSSVSRRCVSSLSR